MTADVDVPTRDCPACHTAVPAAVFCGNCGAELDVAVTWWRVLLRPRVFAAAPRQPVAVPRLTSSLFPRLPRPARQPFRVALVLLIVAMIVLSALRANAPLQAIALLGGPMLFVMYMWQSDALQDISRRALIVAWVTGSGLAVAWWLFTGRLLAGSYGVSTAGGMALQNLLPGIALAFTIGGAIVMVLPPVVVRILRIPVREPLDGFVIGAFGAVSYTAAADTTWMFPQIVTGLLDAQSSWRMFGDAITYGVIDPVTSVALAGVVALPLWFRPTSRHPWARGALLVCVLIAAAGYVIVWVVDALALQYAEEVAINLVLVVAALITLRCALQIVLLHARPPAVTGDPILCVHCEKVVPDLPFCASCGAAAQASSRSSRLQRRVSGPVPESP